MISSRNRSVSVLVITAMILAWTALLPGPVLSAKPAQKVFESPEAAVGAFIKALRDNDEKALISLFGASGTSLISSGDPIDDRERREKFIRSYEERNRIDAAGDRKRILVIGSNEWPFPVPIVKKGNGWIFDTKQGKEEIINRRVGENEREAKQTCLAYVDAQREYAALNREGLVVYAQKFESSRGKRDGLYWEAGPKEVPSPLGPLVARARTEGYLKGEKPEPYNGYLFRILTGQGKSAKGGAYSYIVDGKMVGGFALVAYPSAYASTGVNTFIVNHDGVVYQKDLGPKSVQIAKKMAVYNPDKTWKPADTDR